MGERVVQDSACFFKAKFRGEKKRKENNRKPQRSPPLNISGAEVWGLGVGFFLFFLFVCFVFVFFFVFCFSSRFFRTIFKNVHFIKFIKYFHI